MNELKFHYGKITYEWDGGFGSLFHSFEKGKQAGDVRAIHGELFYVYDVNERYTRGWSRRPKVSWIRLTREDLTTITELKRRFFGL